MVGKPVFQPYTGTYWGSWMRDPHPVQGFQHKFWHTRHFTGQTIYEYDTEYDFRQNKFHLHRLDDMYFGTGHVVYSGSLYYHRAGHGDVVKYNLINNTIDAKVHFHKAAHSGLEFLYSTEYNFFDLATDENGLWVIYAGEDDLDHVLVSKLNPDDLSIMKTWNISVRHREYGNGFITCGTLYLVHDTRAKTTTIDFAYDLYTKEKIPSISLRFTNPFQMNNMISYNPSDKKIYSWDKGNQLTYPLLL